MKFMINHGTGLEKNLKIFNEIDLFDEIRDIDIKLNNKQNPVLTSNAISSAALEELIRTFFPFLLILRSKMVLKSHS